MGRPGNKKRSGAYTGLYAQKEDDAMCDSIQTEQQMQDALQQERRDVDDLIFCHEKEWTASQR